MQTRLLAQQVSTGLDQRKKVTKAKSLFEACDAEVMAEATDARNHVVRGAFVVFNEQYLAEDAISHAPRGLVQSFMYCLILTSMSSAMT
jgi:hypothetical protein